MLKFGSSLSARNVLSMFDQKFGIGIGSFGTIRTAAGKLIPRNSSTGRTVRTKGGTQRIGVLGALTMLPRALATLGFALPLGGALGIAAGALNLAAAGVSTANLVGRAGLLATSGVMGATGGLGGGGKSGNVKKQQKQMQMVQSALNKKGPTGKGSKGGTGIANVQSTLADFDVPEGSMSILPTGDEDGMGMLSGMLQQIAVNTSYLGGIDSKIDSLVGLSSISVIDQAQEDRGDGPPGEKADGMLKRSFNSLKDGFSSIGSSLGGAGKSLIKGLGLIGGLIAFKKFEPQITSGLGSLFENVAGFFDTMGAGADPSDGIVGYFDNIMENSILPSLVTMAEKAIEVIFRGIKIALNQVLPGFLQLDTQQNSSGKGNNITESQAQTNQFFDAGRDLGNVAGFNNSLGMDIILGDKTTYGLTGKGDVGDDEKEFVMQAVRDRLQYMYDVFDSTDGRVRWTEIGPGFTKGGGIDSLNGTFSVADVLYKSQPIVDGFKRPESILDMPLSVPDLTGDALADFMVRSRQQTRIKQKLLMPRGFMELQNILMETGIFSNTFEELEEIFKFNEIRLKDLKTNDGASLGNGQGEITAAIDASHNSQHMHETTVAGLTNVYHSDLNMPAFMNNNQVA